MHVLDVRWRHGGLALAVDGTDLRELVARVEEAITGDPGIAGDYAPLGLPRRDVLAQLGGSPVWSARGRTVLLSCSCGDWACSPLVAEVAVADATVTWQRLEGGVSDEDLPLGPFVFDRRQYEDALQRAASG